MYVCMKCGKDVKSDSVSQRVRCPFCGYKILTKKRSETVRIVKAK